jgi:hypothetical protein
VASLEPAEGSVEGGYPVAVLGSGFEEGTRVLFGGRSALSVEVRSSAEIAAVVPPGEAPGPVRVEVTGQGAPVPLEGGFTYTAARQYPDVVLDPAELRRAGHRAFVFRDFASGPRPFQHRSFAKVYFGDLTNDGVDELIVLLAAEGKVAVIIGGKPPEEVGLGQTASYGFSIFAQYDNFGGMGTNVALPGDLNGDGLNDIAFSRTVLPLQFEVGRTHVLFGRESWPAEVRMEEEIPSGGAIVLEQGGCDPLGVVAAAGGISPSGARSLFINHEICPGESEVRFFVAGLAEDDGFGAPTAVVRGDPEPVQLPIDSAGPLLPRRFGWTLGGGGDTNGDGVGDGVIGADHALGEGYLVLGGAWDFGSAVITELIQAGRAVRLKHDLMLSDLGRSVDLLRDFDGDGLGDILLGMNGGGDDFHGETHVVFGSRALGEDVREVDLGNPGVATLRLEGEDPYDFAGWAVDLGDWNGDGYSDFGITGFEARNRQARAYVVLGGRDPPGRLSLRSLGTWGFKIVGEEGHWFSGGSPGGMAAGDFDGDGAGDLAIGESTPDGMRVVVVFGQADGSDVFVRGDPNADRRVDLSDGIYILNYLFLTGAVPRCLDAMDIDDDGRLVLTDAIGLLNHIFLGGPPPPAPYPQAGGDPTPDDLQCR